MASQKYQFIKIDSILAKLKRDFKGIDFEELDAIEWIGEALGFMKNVNSSQHTIAFLEVKNYQVPLPASLHYITQIARNNRWVSDDDNLSCVTETVTELEVSSNILDSCGCGDEEDLYKHIPYRPFLDMQYEYLDWAHSKTRTNQYSPVRLADHSFFDSLVCKEPNMENLYHSCESEYGIVGNQIRFNFETGFVAIAHSRSFIDDVTGYPMIPDDEAARAAITYYVGWKLMEQEKWNHREGAIGLAKDAEDRWLKYKVQFKNKTLMPTGVDEHQDLMNQGNHLIPPRNRYFGFFGNLGKEENLRYNNYNRR